MVQTPIGPVDLSLLPTWATAIVLVLVLLPKAMQGLGVLVPPFARWMEARQVAHAVEDSARLEADLANRKAEREQAFEASAGQRQDEIALLSQVIHLTQNVIAQNKELLGFVTDTARADLRDLRAELKTELHTIDARWLETFKTMQQGTGETRILRMEITRLADSFRSVEERLVAYGIIGGNNGEGRSQTAGDAAQHRRNSTALERD